MGVSCVTTQLIVYYPVDAPLSVSKYGIKSLLCMRSLAYGSRLKNLALGGGVCIYTYPGGTPFVSEFEFSHCHQVTQVAFLADVACIVVEVHACLCASSMSVDSLLCQFGKERSRLFNFHKPLLGVFLLQPSPCFTQEAQHPASSLPRLWLDDSWLVVAFPLLRRMKTLLWLLWSYSRQDACRTVQAVPDLCVLP